MAAKPQNKPPADVPTDFGKHLRACMRCKLLKTFEQVRQPASRGCVHVHVAWLRRVRCAGACACGACAARVSWPLTLEALLSRCAARRRVCSAQFYDKGCENCPKLDMEGNRPRIEECTTTHFNGCDAAACGALVLRALRPRRAQRSAASNGLRAGRPASVLEPTRRRTAAVHPCAQRLTVALALQHHLRLQPHRQLVCQVAARWCVPLRGLRAVLCARWPVPSCAASVCAERQVPGCYALSVTDKIAEDVMEQLEE